MNDKKRQKLSKAMSLLREAAGYVNDVKDDEDEALSNMPENLQYSDRYEKMEKAVDALESAGESIESAIDNIDEATE